jgi:hypothetical protein
MRSQVWEELSQERDGSRLTDSHARNGCGNATVRGNVLLLTSAG